MLCYSEKVWKKFLNPPGNLNRLRLKDYEKIFNKYFTDVKYKITESNIKEFKKIKGKIMSEFITGNDEIDAVTQIVIIASKPFVNL